jgi:hypothetical protein
MADLRFDADTMRLRINSTKGLLNQGTSVCVWLVHEGGFGTQDMARARSTSLIPGRTARRSSTPAECTRRPITSISESSGTIRYDPDHLEMGIRKDAESQNQMTDMWPGDFEMPWDWRAQRRNY